MRKMFKVAIVFTLVFLQLLIVQLPVARSAVTAQEKALRFLSDVASLDMGTYDAKLRGVTEMGPFGSQVVTYTLDCNESKLDVLFWSKGDTYVWCSLTPLKGSPLFAKESTTSTKEETVNLLRRYEANFAASHVGNMLAGLERFQELRNDTTMIGDIKLETSVSGNSENNYERMTWMRTVNGINNTFDILSLHFHNGVLTQFCDSWNLYNIGSGDAKVNQEEAIRIAKDNAYIQSGANGDIQFTNFTVIDKSIRAELAMSPRNDSLLYPMWGINLGLDKVYFNQVTEISVSIWADTGEIAGISSGGSYGGQSSDQDKPTVQPSIPEANNSPPTSMYLVVGIAATIAAVTITTIALKRRRK